MARPAPDKDTKSPKKKSNPPAEQAPLKEDTPKETSSPKKTAKPRTRKKTARKKIPKKPPTSKRLVALLLSLEILGLLFSLLTAVVVVLGYAAGKFSGTEFFTHLLPFTLGVTALIVVTATLLLGWLRLRRWVRPRFLFLPPALALVLALSVGGLTLRGDFFFAFSQFRILVGAKEEAARVTLTHQIFAAYRRLDAVQEQILIDRARAYGEPMDEAAESYGLDPDLLRGLAATESSFLPRDSKDGGKGLFQITQVPQHILLGTAKLLGVEKVDVENYHHNAFVAAATLRY